MAHQPYFKQKLETLEYPENMRSVVDVAREMFINQSFYGGEGYKDDENSSRLYWETGDHHLGTYERMAVNAMNNTLIIAIERDRLVVNEPEVNPIFHDFRRASLSISMGWAGVYLSNPTNPWTESDQPKTLQRGYQGPEAKPYDFSHDFRMRMNHSMARLGLEWQLAS